MFMDMVRAAAAQLTYLHRRFVHCFGRRESREHSQVYVNGLLRETGRKSVEPMALHFGGGPDQPRSQAEVLGLQRFLTDSPWESADVQREIQAVFREQLVPSTRRWPIGTVGVIDESSFVKRGTHSVGVARQHCGRLGKVENCQVGVFLLGVTPDGTALLDHQLYVSKEWLHDNERRGQVRIPDDLTFATKPQIAAALIERNTVPLDWITADDLYGRNGEFLTALEARGQRYVADIPGFLRVWIDDPARWLGAEAATKRPSKRIEAEGLRRPDQLAKNLPPEAWQPIRLREGTKGPLVYEFARQRVWAVRDRKAGPPVWLVMLRSLEATPTYRYCLSNADADTPLDILAQVIGCRCRVEEFFEDAKGHLGMADYEARAWTSWHHHMSLVALAHLYVTLTRQSLQADTPELTLDMAMQLLQATLPRPHLTEEDAVEIVQYHLNRNAVAQQSHRKTWINKHKIIAEKLML